MCIPPKYWYPLTRLHGVKSGDTSPHRPEIPLYIHIQNFTETGSIINTDLVRLSCPMGDV